MALQPYQNALGVSDVQAKRSALQNTFRICLEADSSVTVGNGWDKPERVENAYAAVRKIISAIGRELYNGDDVLGALQFVRTFKYTRLRLVQLSLQSGAAASTEFDNDISTIGLFTGSQGNFLHIPENIVHEFGHVLLDQNRGAMYDDWEVNVRLKFTNTRDAIGVADGWSNPGLRQNSFAASTFPDCADASVLCQKFEIERIADLFLFWVYQDNPDYDFDTSNTNSFLRDVAIAMKNFISNEPISWTRTVSGTTINLMAQGMRHWILTAEALNIITAC
jgi:hypothetical protein